MNNKTDTSPLIYKEHAHRSPWRKTEGAAPASVKAGRHIRIKSVYGRLFLASLKSPLSELPVKSKSEVDATVGLLYPRKRAEGELRPHARFMGVLYPFVGIWNCELTGKGCGDPQRSKRAEVRYLRFLCSELSADHKKLTAMSWVSLGIY